jgi:hypothetical protein
MQSLLQLYDYCVPAHRLILCGYHTQRTSSFATVKTKLEKKAIAAEEILHRQMHSVNLLKEKKAQLPIKSEQMIEEEF